MDHRETEQEENMVSRMSNYRPGQQSSFANVCHSFFFFFDKHTLTLLKAGPQGSLCDRMPQRTNKKQVF